MQGNDIGVAYHWKHVIIMEGTIIAPPAEGPARVRGVRRRAEQRAARHDAWLDQWLLNRTMCQWIVHQALGGVQSEIWSFLPDSQYDVLSRRIHQIAEDGILAWERWVDPLDALTRLRSDNTIDAVYDADYERIATLWKMRGHAVRAGATP